MEHTGTGGDAASPLFYLIAMEALPPVARRIKHDHRSTIGGALWNLTNYNVPVWPS
jgi:hypothetical protein